MPSDPLTISVVQGDGDEQRAQRLLREYVDHLYSFIDPALLQHRTGEFTTLPDYFRPPVGALLIAHRAGRDLGCIGVRAAEVAGVGQSSELCRLYVRPEARGRQVGWQLIQRALAFSRARHDTAAVLNSIDGNMDAAQHLYQRAGFRRIPPYKDVAIPHAAFFRLDHNPEQDG